jgi:hypothetical protein
MADKAHLARRTARPPKKQQVAWRLHTRRESVEGNRERLNIFPQAMSFAGGAAPHAPRLASFKFGRSLIDKSVDTLLLVLGL